MKIRWIEKRSELLCYVSKRFHLMHFPISLVSTPHIVIFFIFSYFLFIFYFGSCGRLSWLNSQLSSARKYSIFTSLFTYSESGLGVAPWRLPAKFLPPKLPIENAIISDRPWHFFKGYVSRCPPIEDKRWIPRSTRTKSVIETPLGCTASHQKYT